MDRPGDPWSIKVYLKSQERLKLDPEMLAYMMHPLGIIPIGEYLKSHQPVPLRLSADFDDEVPS